MIPRVFHPDDRPVPQLVHFVGRARGDVRLPDAVRGLSAEQRLAQILGDGLLRAFPVPGTGSTPVTCMSDISPADLESAFRTGLNTRGPLEPWAVVLHRDGMWGAGARPVFYADYADLPQVQQALEKRAPGRGALAQRIDITTSRSDWTHEREWRLLPRHGRDGIAVWPQLDAVVVGVAGWQPPNVERHPDASRVHRWWWDGDHLIDDGFINQTTAYS